MKTGVSFSWQNNWRDSLRSRINRSLRTFPSFSEAINEPSPSIPMPVNWFLFCPITVGTIAADLMPRSKRVLAGEGLPGVFFGESLECPVYRLLIDPGCAYIAPTENLIHDG